MPQTQQSKYQKGETRLVRRSDIKEAPYNPRVIGEGAEKRLRKMIKKTGLLGTLIWNERTGNLVSGHQRLKQLDALEGYQDKNQEYELLVSVVQLSDKEEREANIFMNNPSVQGEWDYDKLGDMVLEGDLDAADMGFTDADFSVMFGSDPRFDELFNAPDSEEVAASKEQIKQVRDHRAASTDKMQQEQNADFFFTVVCQSQKAKSDLLKYFNIPAYENYVNGALVAKKCGVALDEK